MKKYYLILFVSFLALENSIYCQDSAKIKAQFIEDLNSGKVDMGCKIVVYVVDGAANAACFVPEPTVSKVACAAAKILNVGVASNFTDPNIPNPIEEICKMTYATTNTGIKYTFDFSKDQKQEIEKTWLWLNTLEGSIKFMEYLSQ